MSAESLEGQSSRELEDIEILREYKGWFLWLGIALIILGIAAISLPMFVALGIDLIVGAILVIGGIIHIGHAFMSRKWKGFILGILVGIIYLVAGIIMLVHPLEGVLTLTLILVAFFIVDGLFNIGLALKIRPISGWFWPLFNGILALILAGLIWSAWPSSAAWAIGLLVGIDIIFSGIIMVGFALKAPDL
ncbi:MAG TPA: HdeD family acid-resistance protein [Methanotrichaceae archaeon]|nr:HdeD family acid-resistance protein [Methanotrichaceae archaeon]